MIALRRAVALVALALANAWCLAAAQATETPGWYVGAEGGWSHLMDPSGTRTTPSTSLSFTTHPKEGFAGGGAAGYAFRWGLRIEGEFVFRQQDLQSFTSPPSGVSTPAKGRIGSVAMMGNLLYDFSNRTRWTPYVGVGVGGARLHLDKFGAATTATAATLTAADWRLAYQGIAGVSFAITPALSLSFDYRYFATTKPTFLGALAGTPTTITTDYATHNVMLNLAYHFGAPPAPPPPAPAATPQPMPAAMAPLPAPPAAAVRQFTIYFDFDHSDLTAEGARVMQDAVATFRQTGAARIAVTGHTDLAGSQLYNMKLSKRRADTVRAALVRAGVPDGVISEAWRGKQQPAVQTPDGVREPRNRRVEIVL